MLGELDCSDIQTFLEARDEDFQKDYMANCLADNDIEPRSYKGHDKYDFCFLDDPGWKSQTVQHTCHVISKCQGSL